MKKNYITPNNKHKKHWIFLETMHTYEMVIW